MRKTKKEISFSPYLQDDEVLLWVGIPQKNPYIRIYDVSNGQSQKRGLLALVLLVSVYLVLVLVGEWLAKEGLIALQSADSWINSMGAIFGVVIIAASMVNIGRVYYAISNQRLLILRRPLWNRVEASPLKTLPRFRIESQADGCSKVKFKPIKRQIQDFRGDWVYTDVQRQHLENLSHADALQVQDLLFAAKLNELDEYIPLKQA